MAPGIQLILPGDFQKEHGLFQAVNVQNPWTKVRCSGVQSPVSDDESPVHSGQQGCITLFRDLSRMVFTLQLFKGAKDT